MWQRIQTLFLVLVVVSMLVSFFLPIWRITKDEVFNTNTLEREKLDGTLGMALSGIVTAGYNFNVKSGIRLLMGKKIMQRDVNPDALTPEEVSTLSYFYRF